MHLTRLPSSNDLVLDRDLSCYCHREIGPHKSLAKELNNMLGANLLGPTGQFDKLHWTSGLQSKCERRLEGQGVKDT